jgi:hypothetical protein
MVCFYRNDSGFKRRTQSPQIAEYVQDLVADEFVGKTQAFKVDDAVMVHHYGVVQAAAEREACGAHYFNVL